MPSAALSAGKTTLLLSGFNVKSQVNTLAYGLATTSGRRQASYRHDKGSFQTTGQSWLRHV